MYLHSSNSSLENKFLKVLKIHLFNSKRVSSILLKSSGRDRKEVRARNKERVKQKKELQAKQ